MKYVFTIEMNGEEPVMESMGIQMTGMGNDLKAMRELTLLPYWLGVNMAVLEKKVLGNINGEIVSKLNEADGWEEDLNSELFRKGFVKGIKDVDAMDRATAPATVTGFTVKEEE